MVPGSQSHRETGGANHTPQGRPSAPWIASPRINGSLILIAMPPSRAFIIPTPMNHKPSVAMNEGTFSRTWTMPFAKPTTPPTTSHEERSQQAEIIAVQAVEDRHRDDRGGESKDSLDRQIDRPHQYDESFAEAEDKRDRGILADPDEVSEAKEVVVGDGDDEAQKDEHHRQPPAAIRRRAPSRSRARDGRNFPETRSPRRLRQFQQSEKGCGRRDGRSPPFAMACWLY